mmetsp:Transcript_105349/g.187290  ORF Transcript_105349/g.187290 Transcript_105349/m.187290 type:complete len:384 (-) Transcript_105349:213-1364(-)
MPLYEEKLICPLAVRFTQDHIRPQFKDRHTLEESIQQIEAKPGSDGYDFILEAPFPSIEIIRWSQLDFQDAETETDHWFTLDNRRLYCLQSVASSLWPKKCAARVEVLYAASHGIKRKDTSMSVGRDVTIKHSDRTGVTEHWDWRAKVKEGLNTRLRRSLRGISEEDITGAEDFVASEDGKNSIQELADAPEGPSMLSLAKLAHPMLPADGASTDTGSSAGHDSTATSPRSADLEEAVTGKDMPNSSSPLPALKTALQGLWAGKKGETYEVAESNDPTTWTCIRWDAQGSSKRYTFWYDETSGCISWGLDWSYYAEADEIVENPKCLQWYSGLSKEKIPRFTWHVKEDSWSEPNKSSKGNAKARPSFEASNSWTYRPKARVKA